MSGHNKWSTIKHKKAKEDAKRGKIFTKIIKEITVATKMGGKDPDTNPRLRNAIDLAKENNMPSDNIKKAIMRGAGELEGVTYEEVTYEGYGPGGVAIFVEVLTDNKNRIVSEIRHIFSRNNGNLGENGCVGWMFEQKGAIKVPKDSIDEDTLFEKVIEAGGDDVNSEDDEENYLVYTSVEDFNNVRTNLEKAGVKVIGAELTRIPQNTVDITDESQAKSLIKLLDMLEDNDDVQKCYSNASISDEILAKIEQ